jgi:hypothetical protein
LVRKQGSRASEPGELWVTDLDSGWTEAVLPGTSMSDFDIAPDGDRMAFWQPFGRIVSVPKLALILD